MILLRKRLFFATLAALIGTGLFILSGFRGNAQQLPLNDFVLFGGGASCTGCGVQIGTSTVIQNGRVGSYQLVRTTGNTTINGGVHSGGRIELANSNTINGDLTAANGGSPGRVVLSAGSNASLNGNLFIRGGISIGGGSVSGNVVQPVDSPYLGPSPGGGRTFGTPPLPTLPRLPGISSFSAGTLPIAGTNSGTGAGRITPNRYGVLTLSGNRAVTFRGVGTYVFSSVQVTGNDNRIIFDFAQNPTGSIVLQVVGDVNLGKVNIAITGGGSAARIFMEVHGNGSTSASRSDAWQIASGASGPAQSTWLGTVWAPFGGIRVGSGSTPSKVEGALWSGTQIVLESGVGITHVPLQGCATPPLADAGPNREIVCPANQTTIGTPAVGGFSYSWVRQADGKDVPAGNTATLTVSQPGVYTLTVSNLCGITATDVVEVGYVSCVDPITQNPGGKVDNLIGSELTNIKTNLDEARKYLVLLDNDASVLIEAVAVIGKEGAARSFLESLGLTAVIPNGLNYQVISGKFPIDKLGVINTRPDLINHCRPVFVPVGNQGLVTSEGDKAIGADLVKAGFKVNGEGIRIGVLSDSYNTLPNNPALQDVNNGDLPGSTNPDGNATPVMVLQEGRSGSDEGRAMLQIIHDLAPKASLAFRTGFNSAGDFAQGILELRDAGCQVMVDDITYVTEPFFQDGVVSRAVNQVAANGVAYFTSAGNFGARSYTNTFKRAAAPGAFAQAAHDFGSGDIYQRLKLKSGSYTIVLQWQDGVYSLAQPAGTRNDLDIYLVDAGGRIGFNRNNFGGDPFEVLSFSINLPDTAQVLEADLLITKADNGLDNPLFKYIIFRGNAVIDEYYAGQPLRNKSTIVGHANAAGAITVGAVLFSNTPAFGKTPSVASFSSVGGTPVLNGGGYEFRGKPELTAPNGVNTSTTVAMGPDNDGLGNQDGFPNFFGTSAAAPHAAAAAALVLQARQKFYNQSLTIDVLRFLLFESALQMQPDGIVEGFNYKAGFGLVRPDSAIRRFANPLPEINRLVYDAAVTPGLAPFTLIVEGNYLTAASQVLFRGMPLPTTYLSGNRLQATIPAFLGNPPISVATPSFPGATGDGGVSKSLFFFGVQKDLVTVIADNKTKRYGEPLPQLTASIKVNGDPLDVFNQKTGRGLTPELLGLTSPIFRYTTPGLNALSDVGAYQIRVSRSFDPADENDVALLELYQYDSVFGRLQVDRLDVTVKPRDTAIVYGAPLDGFGFEYLFDPTATIADKMALTNAIRTVHETYVDNNVLGVLNRAADGGAVVIFNGQVYQVFNNACVIIEGRLFPVVNRASDGGAVVIFNGQELPVVSRLADGGAVVIFNGSELPVVNNFGGAVVIFNGQLLPVTNRADGGAVVIFNGVEYPVVNRASDGGAVVIFNGQELPVVNVVSDGGAVVIFNGQYYPVINRAADGGAVVIFNGQELPVVNRADGGAVVIFNGAELPVLNGGNTGEVIFFNNQLLTLNRAADGGAVVIFNGSPQVVPYLNGEGGGAVVIFNGKPLPVINRADGGAVVIFNGVQYPVVNRAADGGAVVIFNGQELPLVNSLSPQALANTAALASVHAIANARGINSQTNGFIDVSTQSLVAFNSSPNSATMTNALPYVNARAIVEANALANGGAVVIFNRAVDGGAVPIFNGSGAFVNSNTLSSTAASRTPVVVDAADLNSTGNNSTQGATIQMKAINLITGITAGTQSLIPAALFSGNFNITYDAGTVQILPADLTLKAGDASKFVGDPLSLSPSAFTITQGTLRYGERLLLAAIASAGTPATAPQGTYPITAKGAIGAIGTNVSNYKITYQPGTLTVAPLPCPVVQHGQSSNFVNSTRTSLSLWLNIQIKLRGQLARAGDFVSFKGGRVSLVNVSSNPIATNVLIPNGTIIAAAVPAPVTVYDPLTGSFITRVPVGFSSTADIFLTGALLPSSNGFTRGRNPRSEIKGIFQSNVAVSTQWNFSMAAYSARPGGAYVQYNELATPGSVVAVSGTYKAGTPLPWLTQITAGGYGNGGTNYTGSPSNYQSLEGCVPGAVAPALVRQAKSRELQAPQEVIDFLHAFPNPARNEVTIRFVARESGPLNVGVFNSAGQQVSELFSGIGEGGKVYTQTIGTAVWPDGLYLIRLSANKQRIARKLLVRH